MTSPAGVVDGLLADRYRLQTRIGVGGMGEVWRAEDLLLQRPVAVKTLLGSRRDDSEHRARFRAEARAAARLSSPGIAAIHDFGELRDSAWIVMELVEGEPLSRVLRRTGRLSVEQTLDVVEQVAAALMTAHASAVVHRDIKPGNLLVQADGAVKVTDFGIATTTDALPLTRTGQVIGTPGYLSPEQAAGGPASPQSDLYALGVVAYECLSGVRPFVAENPVAELLAHLQAPPPDLPADVPLPVRSLVLRLLSKQPADRPPDAATLRLEVQAVRAALVAGGGTGAPRTTGTGVRRQAPPPVPTATAVLPTSGSGRPASDSPGSAAVGVRPPLRRAGRTGGSPRQTQRRAVRTTALLLALLAVGMSLSKAWEDRSTRVPVIAVGTPEGAARAVVRQAELRPVVERRADEGMSPGQVLAVRPTGGTELPLGEDVVIVVSTGSVQAASTPVEDATPSSPAGQLSQRSAAEAPGPGTPTAPATQVPAEAAEAPSSAPAPTSPAGQAGVTEEAPPNRVAEPPPAPAAQLPAERGKNGGGNAGRGNGGKGENAGGDGGNGGRNGNSDRGGRSDSGGGKGGGP